jgi:hypothetical protein
MASNPATRLLDIIERIHVENLARKTILRAYSGQRLPPQYQIDQLIEDAKKNPLVAGVVHEQFAAARARMLEDGTLEQVLQEFLQVVPPTKDMN